MSHGGDSAGLVQIGWRLPVHSELLYCKVWSYETVKRSNSCQGAI